MLMLLHHASSHHVERVGCRWSLPCMLMSCVKGSKHNLINSTDLITMHV